MSVPTWKRKISKTEFIYQTYQLEKILVKLIYNTSSKYRRGIGDRLIWLCDSALYHGRIANGIHVKSSNSLDQRLYELEKMKAAIDNIGTLVYIWIEAIREHDGVSKKEDEKLYNKEDDIGFRCEHIITLIDNLKKSDKKKPH